MPTSVTVLSRVLPANICMAAGYIGVTGNSAGQGEEEKQNE